VRRSGLWASGGVRLLPAGTGSLARGLPPAPVGTLFALGERGGIAVEPTAGFSVIFGRNEPEVHVCVGAGDPGVSRHHGTLHHDGHRWALRNTGHLPIRLPGSHLLLSGHEEPLAVAYTPLFIRSSRGREHLLEVRVAGPAPSEPPRVGDEDTTRRAVVWELSDTERLVAVALGQRYLRHEAFPQPLSWNQVAEHLGRLRPGERWSAKRAEHVMTTLRQRLAGEGVLGLTRAEVGEPIGNTINHNLMTELLLSTTLVPPDLRLVEGSPEWP